MPFLNQAAGCPPGRPIHGGLRARIAAMSTVALVVAAACEDPVPPPPEPASITLNPPSVRFNAVGVTVRMLAVVTDENGDTIPAHPVEWATGDSLVATVSQTGLVRAVGHGSTRITATAGPVSAEAPVTVEGDRQALEALYRAAGGTGWIDSRGWMSDRPLGDWFGVETDEDGRVILLRLAFNDLDGSLPPEIGSLTRLQELDVGFNYLAGPLPSELGSLTELRELFLDYNHFTGSLPPEIGGLARLSGLSAEYNDLSGPIPAAVGDLAQLRYLLLGHNRLSGSIPPGIGNLRELLELGLQDNSLEGSLPAEIGNLSKLESLRLNRNRLTGPIPAELGDLANVTLLEAHDNALSGAIPGELGRLSQLTDLWLGGNNLTGPFPAELALLSNLDVLMLAGLPLAGTLPDEMGEMQRLRSLLLTNSGLAGLLPESMTRLRNLEELMLGGTDLCAPEDDGFMAWLEGVVKRRVPSCAAVEDGSTAYLTQTVQSREYPVPLIAGEEALLRVFSVAPAAAGDTVPLVRATFYLNGEVEKVVEIEPGSSLVGSGVDEGSLNASANALIEASVIQPGLEMVVEIDPEGTTDPELGVGRRVPEAGRIAVEVRRMPALDFTLVPFLWETDPDSAILEMTEDLSADDELLWPVAELLPVADFDLKVHDAVVSSSNEAFSLIGQTEAIRVTEGGSGYYMGSMSGTTEGALGVAYSPGWVSFSIPDSSVMAHELAHNMSLPHAPCGGAYDPDPSFPQPDGTIGAWGYDFESGRLVHPSTADLMGYCDPTWISEFFFTNALRHRLWAESGGESASRSEPARSLLVWGGTDPDGTPYLQPAFVIDAGPSLPGSRGLYRLEGTTADGAGLFALNFDMPAVVHADGAGSFAFALPVRPGWEERLARITLSGPGGAVTLNADSDRPAAILRNPRTGQVRAILTDLPPGSRAEDMLRGPGMEPGLEVFFSRGIPDAAAWRR